MGCPGEAPRDGSGHAPQAGRAKRAGPKCTALTPACGPQGLATARFHEVVLGGGGGGAAAADGGAGGGRGKSFSGARGRGGGGGSGTAGVCLSLTINCLYVCTQLYRVVAHHITACRPRLLSRLTDHNPTTKTNKPTLPASHTPAPHTSNPALPTPTSRTQPCTTKAKPHTPKPQAS